MCRKLKRKRGRGREGDKEILYRSQALERRQDPATALYKLSSHIFTLSEAQNKSEQQIRSLPYPLVSAAKSYLLGLTNRHIKPQVTIIGGRLERSGAMHVEN